MAICYDCNRKLIHLGCWGRLVYVGKEKDMKEPGRLAKRS